MELYTGIYLGEFVSLMKVFASWISVSHKMSKINSFSFDDNLVKYEIEREHKKINVILTISRDGDRVLYKSDYLDDNKLDPLMYIFFPFPPYFKSYHEKDYYL